MTGQITAAAVVVALVAGAWWQGGRAERARWEARVEALTAARDRATARATATARALERAAQDRAELARQLEDAADADDDAGRVALPARSVQRIGAR